MKDTGMVTREDRWVVMYWRHEPNGETVRRQEGRYAVKSAAGRKGNELIANKDVWRVEIYDRNEFGEELPAVGGTYWKTHGQLSENNNWPF